MLDAQFAGDSDFNTLKVHKVTCIEMFICNVLHIWHIRVIPTYRVLYDMVQPLCENTPPFCLACVGTNKFSFETILNRWKYIFDECKKRGIHIISFGSDGDSQLLKAMQIASALKFPKCDHPFEVYSSLEVPKIPISWKTWFNLKKFSTVALVQDIVHIAVKLKCRLLKPSVLLPMGDCCW